jgi:hypothetical protein
MAAMRRDPAPAFMRWNENPHEAPRGSTLTWTKVQ